MFILYQSRSLLSKRRRAIRDELPAFLRRTEEKPFIILFERVAAAAGVSAYWSL